MNSFIYLNMSAIIDFIFNWCFVTLLHNLLIQISFIQFQSLMLCSSYMNGNVVKMGHS